MSAKGSSCEPQECVRLHIRVPAMVFTEGKFRTENFARKTSLVAFGSNFSQGTFCSKSPGIPKELASVVRCCQPEAGQRALHRCHLMRFRSAGRTVFNRCDVGQAMVASLKADSSVA